jgi:hypothetical protein
MGKCESAAHVVPATEMRSVKAVAAAMEMASTMAPTVAVATAAVTAAASGQCGAGQHGRQNNCRNPGYCFSAWLLHRATPPEFALLEKTRK